MTKRPPKKSKPLESVVFDRSPGKQKLELDLDVATTNAAAMGVTHVDIVEALLLRAEHIASIAEQNGEDLSSLQGMLQQC